MNRLLAFVLGLICCCMLTGCNNRLSNNTNGEPFWSDGVSTGNSGGSYGGGGGGGGSGGGGLAYVSGVVSPSSPIEKPQQCEVVVRLKDRTSDRVISTQAVDVPKRGFPVPFQVRFERNEIKKNREYTVEARIKVKGKVKWITRENYPVITNGNPTYNLDLKAEPTN